MNDFDVQFHESDQRHQFFIRLQELKRTCQKLTDARDDLYSKLNSLNKVVDQLIVDQNARFPNITTSTHKNPSSIPDQYDQPTDGLYKFRKVLPESNMISGDEPSARNKFIDLNTKNTLYPSQAGHNSGDTHNQYDLHDKTRCKQPSRVFKIKVSHCLREVKPKVEEVEDLFYKLYVNEP